jgi:hypothetical protein
MVQIFAGVAVTIVLAVKPALIKRPRLRQEKK